MRSEAGRKVADRRRSDKSGGEAGVRVRVVRVIDGDSVLVKRRGLFAMFAKPVECRMYGMDAPESSQPLGSESRKALLKMLRAGGVRADFRERDRYGRMVTLFHVGVGASVNYEMVRTGWAYWYRAYGGGELGFGEAETEARQRKRGVWKLPGGGERPWDYRKRVRDGKGSGWRWLWIWIVVGLCLLLVIGAYILVSQLAGRVL